MSGPPYKGGERGDAPVPQDLDARAPDANRNQVWARALIEELARAGVEHVSIAPGSRSTPLVLALAAADAFTVHVHLDERSAAFFALGVGKATRRPAAVVTTSGTAAANLLPAVVEASQSETPLLLLTADRPIALRGADANQAIDQVRLFGGYVRAFFECAHPEVQDRALRHLRQTAARAVALATGPEPGPVHLNVPFAKPLEPTPVPGDLPERFTVEHARAARGRTEGGPYTQVITARAAVDEATVRLLAQAVSGASRGLLVAGPALDDRRTARALEKARTLSDFPLLADPLSGARCTRALPTPAVAAYDLFLGRPSVRDALAPDLVLRFGSSPTSQRLLDWLEALDVPQIVIDPGARWKDHLAVATTLVRADPLEVMEALAGALKGGWSHPSWNARWAAADEAARTALADAFAGEAFEGLVAAQVADALPDGATLFVSNSMPIRDVDAYVLPAARDLRLLGNRGASGIDGIVSTAFGVAASSPGPTAALVGDLAFLHDMNGLLAAREEGAALVLVLVHNDGGGIFHRLPIRAHEPEFTRFFATPHGLDFRHAAALYDLPFSSVAAAEVGNAVRAALAAGGVRIVEVRTDRDAVHRRQRAVADAVQDAVERALSHEPTRG